MIYQGDCLEVLKTFEANSIDVCVQDPPYCIGKLDNTWTAEKVNDKRNMKVVTSLPSGLRFDKSQGKKLREWYEKVSIEVLRVLKPGAFFFSFSAPRLYQNMACAVEDAGFDIRDMFIWMYVQNQPKAMGLNHVIARLEISEQEKENLKQTLSGWKTPQVKSCHEPILMAQKPLEGSFLENFNKHGVGLVNTNVKIGEGMFPSNIASTEEFDETVDRYFLVSKPNKKEKGEFNTHKTVKPLKLCEYLVALTTREGDKVLDCFAGSGTTCLAAKNLNRKYIGIELNQEYVTITKQRLSDEHN